MKLEQSLLVWLIATIGLSLLVGCKPQSPVVSNTLKTWERSRFEPGGGNAMVYFVIYGSFTNDSSISGAAYRTAGVPQGVETRRFSQAQGQSLPFTDGPFGTLLQKRNPGLLARIKESPGCMVIQGEVIDPPNLNYLRDCIGLVTFFMDHRGIGVVDVQQVKLVEAEEWRRDFFEPEKPKAHRHVFIMYSKEESGPGTWFHTRGLRKFGRPDLSLRNVPDNYREAAVELCNRFIELQADGGQIAEGQEIRMKSLPSGLICHHQGSLDDPDFNNVHVEIQFPVAP